MMQSLSSKLITGYSVLLIATIFFTPSFCSAMVAPSLAISTLSPADNATNVAVDANLIITFDMDVDAETGADNDITIKKSSDNSLVATIDAQNAAVSILGAIVTINLPSNLAENTEYYVLIGADAFDSTDETSFDGIADTTMWNFTTGDFTAPTLSALSPAQNAAAVSTDASVTWTTNELASSQVQYGFTSAFGNLTAVTNTAPRVTTHSVSLGALHHCTLYYYRAISIDAAGNTATGATTSFTTTGCTNAANIETQTGSSLPAGSTGSLAHTSDGAGITVEVPDTILTNPVILQIKKLATATVLALAAAPSNKTLAGDHTYDLRMLSGTTVVTSFDAPVTVVLSYTDAQVSGMVESSLRIYRWSGSSWNALSNCVVDTNANTVTCTTEQFSTFGLFGEGSPTAPAVQSQRGGRRGRGLISLSHPSSVSDASCPLSSHLLCAMRERLVSRIEQRTAVAPHLTDHFRRVLERWDLRWERRMR